MLFSQYRAYIRILSEAVAGLPLHLYRYNADGGKEKAIDHPLYFLLHDEPNPEMTSFVFRETLMTHLLLWGNGYAQIIRNGKGEVVALYPLMPDRMTVDRDEKGRLYYEYRVSDSDAPTMKDGTVRLKPSDVLHIPGLGFDGLVGYSPIAMAKNAIGLAITVIETAELFNLSRRKIFRLVEESNLPFMALYGTRKLIIKDEFIKYLNTPGVKEGLANGKPRTKKRLEA